MIRIVADNKIPFLKGAFTGIASIDYLPGNQITNKHLKDADALIVRTRTLCDEALLKETAVRFIATATIGHDHIDSIWCSKNNISWINAPGCNAGSVRQYIASALAFIIKEENRQFKDITLGIIGAGHVGSRVLEMATSLGIKCLVNDPPRASAEGPEGFVPLEELLAQSDIVTLHTPLSLSGEYRTFHMADKSFFERMKKGAWFINTSRGEVHSTQALVQALISKQLSGAVIDVWENEPHISSLLLGLGSITTPHIAGYSLDGKANGTAMSVQAISRFFKLGLDSWRPQNIPPPPHPMIRLSGREKSPEHIFYGLSMKSYDIIQDSDNLKQFPERFETFREEYPVRREPHAHQVRMNNCPVEYRKLIETLGYKTIKGD